MLQPAWKKNDGRSRGFFYKLLLSYIVFLTLPVVLFFIFINSGLLQYAEETVHKANVSKLELVETNIDSAFADMRSTAFRITGETRIMALFSLEYDQRENRFQDMEALYDAYQLASDIRKDYRDAVSIYLYDQSKDIVFSLLESVYTRERFYDTQWIGPAEGAQGETMLGVRDITDTRFYKNPYRQVITYILPLKYLNVNGAVAVNVSLDAFSRNFVSASGGAEEGYTVVDDSGAVIYDVNDRLNNGDIRTPDIVTSVLGRDDRDAGSLLTSAGGKSYLVMYRKAPVSGLTIINTIPLESQYDRIFYYRMLLYVIAGITILLGVTVSYILSARLYNPVKKVMEKLKNQVIIDPRYRRNELGIISEAINELVDNSVKDRQTIETDRKHLRESYVMGLVMGRASETIEYDFLAGNTCCVLVSIDRFESFAAGCSFQEQYYYKSLILKVCEQVVALHARGAAAILEQDKVALLVSADDGDGEFAARLKAVCDGIAGELSAIRDFTISLGIGGTYPAAEDIRKSFLEASVALKYRLIFGHRSIICHGDIASRHGSYAFPSEKLSRLFNHLKLNAAAEIRRLLDELTDDMKSSLNRGTGCDSIMRAYTQLLARTMEYLETESINREELFGADRDLTYELTGKETLDEINVWLDGLFQSIEAYQTAHSRRLSENDHVNKIIEMIRGNYMDSNLSIEWVADRLGLSYSHVRKIFKDSIGLNFVDYLNRMRVANAKQLLLKSELTIKEIAIRSGYNNDQCLTRFFKRYEGITPGKYRINWSRKAEPAAREDWHGEQTGM